jgi:hypothetical protein
MKMNRTLARSVIVGAIVMCLPLARPAAQSPATPDQVVAALKQNLAESQKRLRQYEWIETTVISLKGEEKSRKQQRVYYGADGKLTKVPIGEPQPEAAGGGGGRRGGRVKERVVENKKDDMKDYMERAAALVHQYVPPNPAQIQKVKDAGKLTVTPTEPGRARLEFADYLQPGDRLGIVINAAANSLASLNVATYLDEPNEVVTLDVKFGALTDGTSYTAETAFEAKAKNIRVVIQNSGHKPLAQ